MEETPTTPKPPLALLVQGREPAEIVAYACGACGIVARSEEEARRCCDPRCDCGVPAPRGYTLCDGCRKKHYEEQDRKRQAADQAALEAAPRVTYAAYDGRYLYTERLAGGGDGEGYFPDVAELLEHCLDESIDPPALVWACSPVKMGFNADDLISSACEEMYEDAADEIGTAARDSLQAALDAWCEQHSPTSYHPSRIAVDLSAEVAAWKAEQEAEAAASQVP